ncbi:MAG: replicative DNA helicase, partial [Deltaproteobacteria bacterium]|jgi:replicative DNA helicase|nr:replicative DNA helicase [Deltaproteobacteria bacterium]
LLKFSGDNFPDVLDVGIRPEDFFSDVHGEIYSAMAELYNMNDPIDDITLAERLKQRGTFDRVGGNAYIEEIANVAITRFHSKQYAKIVSDRSLTRKLAQIAAQVSESCQGVPESVDEVLDKAESRIFQLRDTRLNTSLIHLPDALPDIYERIFDLKSLNGTLSGIPTGYSDLDRVTGGFQRTDLIILGGRPGMGKTAITLKLALNAAIPRERQYFKRMPAHSVLFFSLEMGREQIIMRILCQLGRYDLLQMRTGRLTDPEYARLTQTMADLKSAPLYIDDSNGQRLRPLDLRAKARRLQRTLQSKNLPPLGLVVVDYLQLLSPNETHANREREVAEISNGLKCLAKELNVAVLCCSQLKRSDTGKPDLSDLRDSGAIEQDADIVCFILRKDIIDPDDPTKEGQAVLQIKKHRNGPTRDIPLRFVKNCSLFVPAQIEAVDIPSKSDARPDRGQDTIQ